MTHASSVFMVDIALDGPANRLSWYGVSARYYQLEYTDTWGGIWILKGAVVAGSDSAIMKIDIGVVPQRFD